MAHSFAPCHAGNSAPIIAQTCLRICKQNRRNCGAQQRNCASNPAQTAVPEAPRLQLANMNTAIRTRAWPVIGHEAVIHALARDLAAQRLRHAYLFTGPAAIGKHTLATAFAQAIQCDQPNAPCGHCRICQLIAQQRHPGVHVLLPEVSGKIIKTAKIRIETVRDLIRQFALTPMEGARRVALLVDFESANAESANAL